MGELKNSHSSIFPKGQMVRLRRDIYITTPAYGHPLLKEKEFVVFAQIDDHNLASLRNEQMTFSNQKKQKRGLKIQYG